MSKTGFIARSSVSGPWSVDLGHGVRVTVVEGGSRTGKGERRGYRKALKQQGKAKVRNSGIDRGSGGGLSSRLASGQRGRSAGPTPAPERGDPTGNGTRTQTSEGPAVSQETSRFPCSLTLWSTGQGTRKRGFFPKCTRGGPRLAETVVSREGGVPGGRASAGGASCRCEVRGTEGGSPREGETQERSTATAAGETRRLRVGCVTGRKPLERAGFILRGGARNRRRGGAAGRRRRSVAREALKGRTP